MNFIISIVLIANISLYADLVSDGVYEYNKENYGKALRLLTKACHKKDKALACFKLAEIYQDGDNALEDKYTSKEYYKISCDLGLEDGCKAYRKINDAGLR